MPCLEVPGRQTLVCAGVADQWLLLKLLLNATTASLGAGRARSAADPNTTAFTGHVPQSAATQGRPRTAVVQRGLRGDRGHGAVVGAAPVALHRVQASGGAAAGAQVGAGAAGGRVARAAALAAAVGRARRAVRLSQS